MMRPRAGMNLAGGGGRVDEVEGARSCEARPGCSAASSESAIGERVLGPCIDSSMAKSRPVLTKLLAAVVISVRSGCSRRVASCFWESALIWKSPQIGIAALFYRGAEWEWA